MAGHKFAILILMGLAAGTFGVSYGLSLWLGSGAETAAADLAEDTPPADAKAEPGGADPAELPTAHLEEKHLMALVRQVRSKLDDCRQREKALLDQEQRLQVARQDLRTEAEHLETLRGRLATAAANLKEARAALEQTRLAIGADEQGNLKHTAAIYDAMEPEAAAGIVESMCSAGQHADAVKILHFMKERSVAKLLAAIEDRDLVADLCERMKRVHEPKDEG